MAVCHLFPIMPQQQNGRLFRYQHSTAPCFDHATGHISRFSQCTDLVPFKVMLKTDVKDVMDVKAVMAMFVVNVSSSSVLILF